MEKPKILIADDETVIRQLFKRTLGKKDYHVQTAGDGKDALSKIKKISFNVLIIDLQMPGIGGVDVLKEIKKVNPYIEVVIITGYPTVELAVEAIKIGAFDFICKPFDIEKVESVINSCLERQRFNINNIQLSELMSLFEVSKTVTAASDLDNLLGRILDSALEITKAQKGLLVVLNETTKEPGAKVSRDLNKKAKGSRFKVSISLTVQEKVVGMITVADKISGEDFTEREKTLLSIVAGQAAVAIENARLYKQLRDRVEVLEKTINQLNQTQNQLIQSEKMSAVGQLAFGIAHEIRNPLAIILEGVEFIWSSLPEKDALTRESIRRVKRCVDRADNIVTDLLKFSRTSELELHPVNIMELLDETAALIKNQANLRKVKIYQNYSRENIKVNADYNMLQQVFFNLCINAIDAMPKGGSLCIGAHREKRERKDKNKVIVEVEDTGTGIPGDKISKIFNPFFTTKEPGKGTGLGLSIAHLILERHNATIDVQSHVGRGTKFSIKLPAA